MQDSTIISVREGTCSPTRRGHGSRLLAAAIELWGVEERLTRILSVAAAKGLLSFYMNQTVNFVNEAGLQALGNNTYTETAASGSPTSGTPGKDGFGTILQGFLESSNVNPVTELTNLIKAQRVYEMNSKVVTKTDEMLQSLNQSV